VDATRPKDLCLALAPRSSSLCEQGRRVGKQRRLAPAVDKCRKNRFARRNLGRLQVPSATHVFDDPALADDGLGERYANSSFAVLNSAFSRSADILSRFRDALIKAQSRLSTLWIGAVVGGQRRCASLSGEVGDPSSWSCNQGGPLPNSASTSHQPHHSECIRLGVFMKYERLHVTRSPLEIAESQR
jgi:hypothetical protein